MCTSRKDHKSFLGLSECRVPGVWAPPAQYCLGTMGPFVRTARWAVSPHVFSALYLHKMGACPGQGSWIQAAEDCPHRQVQSARDVPELRKQVLVYSARDVPELSKRVTVRTARDVPELWPLRGGGGGGDAEEVLGRDRVRVMQHVTQYCCKAPTLHSQATDAEWSNVTGTACRCATHCWLATYLHEQTLSWRSLCNVAGCGVAGLRQVIKSSGAVEVQSPGRLGAIGTIM